MCLTKKIAEQIRDQLYSFDEDGERARKFYLFIYAYNSVVYDFKIRNIDKISLSELKDIWGEYYKSVYGDTVEVPYPRLPRNINIKEKDFYEIFMNNIFGQLVNTERYDRYKKYCKELLTENKGQR